MDPIPIRAGPIHPPPDLGSWFVFLLKMAAGAPQRWGMRSRPVAAISVSPCFEKIDDHSRTS